MYEFKDTNGPKQTRLEEYFSAPSHKISMQEMADHVRNQEFGDDVRIPLAYAYYQKAKELGHVEPTVTRTNLPYVTDVKPYKTEYVQDTTMYLTEEIVDTSGRNQRELVWYAQDMYGKVPVGSKYEVNRVVSTPGITELIRLGTKDLINVLLPVNVHKNYATNLLVGDVTKPTQTIDDLSIPIEMQQTAAGAGFEIENAPLVAGRRYTICFEYEVTQGKLNDILSYNLDYEVIKTYINNVSVGNNWVTDGGKHQFYMHFIADSSTDNFFSWRFNHGSVDLGSVIWITELNVYEGHIHPFKEVN